MRGARACVCACVFFHVCKMEPSFLSTPFLVQVSTAMSQDRRPPSWLDISLQELLVQPVETLIPSQKELDTLCSTPFAGHLMHWEESSVVNWCSRSLCQLEAAVDCSMEYHVEMGGVESLHDTLRMATCWGHCLAKVSLPLRLCCACPFAIYLFSGSFLVCVSVCFHTCLFA